MRLALQAAAGANRKLDWSGCRIARTDAQKCFVLLQSPPTQLICPRKYWVCAVWHATGKVDELGDWEFHWGVSPFHAIEAYEHRRAAGRPWPMGLGDWFDYQKELEEMSHREVKQPSGNSGGRDK
jgi:hypothetical protein